jgi:type II secretory pathway pseudopilin PulG
MLRRVPFRQRNGFTTIESLIAAVVFLVGLAGLLGALVQARGATGQARRLMQATDIANDLAEQIQLWDFNDPRLVANDVLCANDPLDKNGVLLKRGSPEYTAYVACMHGELMLKLGGAKFGGLPGTTVGSPGVVFKDEGSNATRYERFYIVRVQDVRDGVRRMQVWVKVLYLDAGEPRVVTTQTMRIFMGGV